MAPKAKRKKVAREVRVLPYAVTTYAVVDVKDGDDPIKRAVNKAYDLLVEEIGGPPAILSVSAQFVQSIEGETFYQAVVTGE